MFSLIDAMIVNDSPRPAVLRRRRIIPFTGVVLGILTVLLGVATGDHGNGTDAPVPASAAGVSGPPRKTDEDLHFIYVNGLERVPTNGKLFPIDDDFFQGHFLPMFRKDAEPPTDDEEGRKIYQHFQGRKRMFEFQFQGRLKQLPEGNLWLTIEIDMPVKIGRIKRALFQGVLNFLTLTHRGIHYSFGDDLSKKSEDDVRAGNYEKLHMSFALECSLSRLVISGPDDKDLPKLGEDIPESRESVKLRKAGVPGSFQGWNTESIYTMSIWAAYIDFYSWNFVKLPGIRSFAMSKFFGNQPINVMYYSLRGRGSDINDKRPHLRKDLNVFSHYEIGHAKHTNGGHTQEFMKRRGGGVGTGMTGTDAVMSGADDIAGRPNGTCPGVERVGVDAPLGRKHHLFSIPRSS